MKKFLVCLLAFLLVACSKSVNSYNDLDEIFENTEVGNVRVNNYTNYIEYYLPSDVNEESSEQLSFVFNVDEEKFILNINISGILNKEYYENTALYDDGFFDSQKLAYEKSGSFNNVNDEKINYFVKVYEHENSCLLNLVTNEVTMYGFCTIEKLGILASKMYQMARVCNVHYDAIVADFSTKNVIDYEKTAVNLFEKLYPESGRVEDMLVDKSKMLE